MDKGVQSQMFSGKKPILKWEGHILNNQLLISNSLTKACRITNDCARTLLPIHIGLLEILLFKLRRKFQDQLYLCSLFKTFFLLS